MPYFFLSVAIVSEVIATTALKSSEGFTRLLPSLLVVCGYGASFYFLAQCLKGISIGVVYAIWSGVGIVLVTLLGWLFFGEKLDGASLLGIGLITAGVIVLNVFSKVASH